MKSAHLFIMLILVIAGSILVTGCTNSNPPKPADTQVPPTPVSPAEEPLGEQTKEIPEESITPLEAATPGTVESSLFESPVSEPPLDLVVSVSARKDPVYHTITVTFDGGKGQQLLKSLTVRVTDSEGKVTEVPLGTNKGDEVEIAGTNGDDRVQVVAAYKNGTSFHIHDQTVKGQTRVGTVTDSPTIIPTPGPDTDPLYGGPVTEPPVNLNVMVETDKDPIYRVITSTFRGGHGQSLVKTITIRAQLSDGTEVIKEITNNIGSTAEIQGTAGVDKVQVIVFYKNGEHYKIGEKSFGPRG